MPSGVLASIRFCFWQPPEAPSVFSTAVASQVDVYQSLQAAGVLVNTSSGSSRAQPLVSLARALGNGLLDVLRSSKKRPQIMYSLTINTLLLPQLCMFDHQASPSLSFLHEGPHAPLRRFIQGLLAQGCKGSPRLMLALGLQLGAYLAGNAQLLVWYAAELRQLLMFGVAAQVGPEELTLVGNSAHTDPFRHLMSSSTAAVDSISCLEHTARTHSATHKGV